MANQNSRRIAAALVGVVCAFSTADNALAQCQYEMTAIINGPLCWGSALPLTGTGMNQLGHVTGSHWDCSQSGHDHGFFWTPQTGRVTMHKPPGVWRVNPTDINDAGLIVGTMQITGIGGQGFVYDMHTQQYLAILPPLHDGHPPLNIVSTINAINNAGIAVGARVISKPGVVPAVSNAVIWNTNTGEVIDLGVGEGPNSMAEDGTESNDGAGWTGTGIGSVNARAVAWFDKSIVKLGVLPGHVWSYATRMNTSRVVTGVNRTSQAGTPFLWKDGKMMPFPAPDGYEGAGASDLNDVGQITGSMRAKPSAPLEFFLYQHGEFHNLADLIVDPPPGLNLTSTTRIGNDGRILARASTRAVLLTPVGQPIGDLNHDCRVDVHDLHMLLDAWGPLPRAKRQKASLADLNGDGVVDVSDLLILLANWSN